MQAQQNPDTVLEDKAVKVTCDAMGCKIPENWRSVRNEMKEVYSPVMDLSEWGRRKTTNSSNAHHVQRITCKGNVPGDGEEEKKDSPEEDQKRDLH